MLSEEEIGNKELKKGINSLMQSRRKWKNRYYKIRKTHKELIEKLEEDKIEQFDDYTIYLIESYLKILKGENNE